MTEHKSTHGVTLDFGRHKGQLITRVPVGYLKWMVREHHDPDGFAAAELARRGTELPAIEVSGHAIDRFTQRYLYLWTEHVADTGEDVGLWTYLNRRATAAWAAMLADVNTRKEEPEIKVTHEGERWVFANQGEWPVVMTVM